MEHEYIKTRLADQMDYYKNRAKKLQRQHKTLSGLVIILNALLTVFTVALSDFIAAKYFIIVFSASASAISGFLLLEKPKEKWVVYRHTYEQLKKELILFNASAGRYQKPDIKEFIVNCEELMDSEHNAWKDILEKEN